MVLCTELAHSKILLHKLRWCIWITSRGKGSHTYSGSINPCCGVIVRQCAGQYSSNFSNLAELFKIWKRPVFARSPIISDKCYLHLALVKKTKLIKSKNKPQISIPVNQLILLSQLPNYRNFKFLVKQEHLFTLGKLRRYWTKFNSEQRKSGNCYHLVLSWAHT